MDRLPGPIIPKMSIRHVIAVSLILCFGSLAAQEAGTDRADKHIIATRIENPPVIDGVLDDEAWSHATIIEDIHQIRPFEYGQPTQRTRFYLAYDSDNIYVGMRA